MLLGQYFLVPPVILAYAEKSYIASPFIHKKALSEYMSDRAVEDCKSEDLLIPATA